MLLGPACVSACVCDVLFCVGVQSRSSEGEAGGHKTSLIESESTLVSNNHSRQFHSTSITRIDRKKETVRGLALLIVDQRLQEDEERLLHPRRCVVLSCSVAFSTF